ncbi:hypothetical protein ANN_02488 [Periplaneta americana]|uniref:Uncharacterized protein n=1 Tax=Periplaneta americana TaxID=6978 RepID=A0ABQ8TZD1_PERAM|nr:hypothetical protein ANN_02488 [Periplaneta americana]
MLLQYVLCREDLRTTVVDIATTRLKLLHTSWDPVRTAKLCETLDTTKFSDRACGGLPKLLTLSAGLHGYVKAWQLVTRQRNLHLGGMKDGAEIGWSTCQRQIHECHPDHLSDLDNHRVYRVNLPQVHHDAGWAPVPCTGRNFMRKFSPHEDSNQRAFRNASPRQDALNHDPTARD